MEEVARSIVEHRQVPKKHHPNCRKQARHLSYCLRQAFSYFAAAKAVGEDTRPLLLYYACTALASAQVLWRGDGNQSLDKVRAEHGAHGLEFSLSSVDTQHTDAWLAGLKARPRVAHGNPYGLFALWRQFAREDCLVGTAKTNTNTGIQTSGAQTIFMGEPSLGIPPRGGTDMLGVLQSTPAMAQGLADVGIRPRVVRGKISLVQDRRTWQETTTVVIHPGPADLVEAVSNSMLFPPSAVDSIQVREGDSGFILTWSSPMLDAGQKPVHFPSGVSLTADLLCFRTDLNWLNEFGLYYVGLYMAGMLCRYHPDEWMKALDTRSRAALLLSEFGEIAAERMPVLTLGVLENAVFVGE